MLINRSLVSRSALAAITFVCVLFLCSCHQFFVPATLTSISINPSNPNLVINSSQQMTATGINNDGSSAGNVSVTWSLSSGCVSTINASGLLTTGSTAETCTITATSTSNSSLTGTTTLTVTTSALTGITISASNSAPVPPTTVTMTATGTYANGSTSSITPSWTSSDPTNAPINSSGIVTISTTATTGEIVTITATSGTISAQTTLTIE